MNAFYASLFETLFPAVVKELDDAATQAQAHIAAQNHDSAHAALSIGVMAAKTLLDAFAPQVSSIAAAAAPAPSVAPAGNQSTNVMPGA